MTRFVIDSNVLVHWLMSHKIIGYIITEQKLSPEFKRVYDKRYEKSVRFIDYVLSNPRENKDVVVVEFSLSEIFSGVREEARTVIMLNKGIPLSRWISRRETREATIPEKVGKRIYELTLEGFDVLFRTEVIGIIPTATPSAFPDFFEVYSSLIFYNPELTTQDALLLTTAIFEDTDYFVTMDGYLTKLNKALRDAYNIRIIRPDKALNIYRS